MGRRLGAIALLAMLVRAIVPAGYMLAAAETAGGRYLTVQMCSGHANATQVIDLDTGKPVDAAKLAKDSHGKSQNGKSPNSKSKSDPRLAPCVFAGAPVVGHPVALAEPVEFLAEVETDFGVAGDVRPGRGIPAPPPPATGPPSLI